MNKYLVVAVIFVVIIITSLSFYYQLQLRQERENHKQSCSQIMLLYDMLKEEQEVLMKNEGCMVSKSLYLTDLKNQKIKIDSLFSEGPFLVLFFSSSYCNDCVNYCLTQIKDFMTKQGFNKIILFASGYQLRDLYVFARSNQFNDKCFYSMNSLNIPIEETNMPFMFIMDEKLMPSHFFIPKKEIPEQTERYLNFINEEINSTALFYENK
ncbi:MAG: hypothetical protein LBL07_02620 [Tannerella sp.]|jgi:hypothetical protein|nr:hypothetical protein [Tannerella sp.]